MVDANTGEILYRHNNVDYANTDVNVTATLYPTIFDPTLVEPLKYLFMNVGRTNYFADNTAYLGLSNTSPVNATLYLQGR